MSIDRRTTAAEHKLVWLAANVLSAYKFVTSLPELEQGWLMANTKVTSTEISGLLGLPVEDVERIISTKGKRADLPTSSLIVPGNGDPNHN